MREAPTTGMPDPNSSLWAWMAHDLRFYREKCGMSLTQLGNYLGRTRGSVSAIEHGRRRLNDKDTKLLDEKWETGGHFCRLLYYARISHDPDWFKTFTQFENRASVMKIYAGQLIPTPLQTVDYARSLLAAGRTPDLESSLSVRMERQNLITKENAPDAWILLAETAMACLVGGVEVMRTQMNQLLEISHLPNVTLRVVPNSAGANYGLEGPFKIITVPEGDAAYVEAPNGGRLILDTDEVRAFQVRFDRIGAVALPIDSSRGKIEHLMETL